MAENSDDRAPAMLGVQHISAGQRVLSSSCGAYEIWLGTVLNGQLSKQVNHVESFTRTLEGI